MKTAKKSATKKAFRFPRKFTATVTQAIFDASVSRLRDGKEHFSVFHDCPVAVAARRALKLNRNNIDVTRVDCTVYAPVSFKSRRYVHDGEMVAKAFDMKVAVKLPQTVTFTPQKVQE